MNIISSRADFKVLLRADDVKRYVAPGTHYRRRSLSKDDYEGLLDQCGAGQYLIALLKTLLTLFDSPPHSLWSGNDPKPGAALVKWTHVILAWRVTEDSSFLYSIDCLPVWRQWIARWTLSLDIHLIDFYACWSRPYLSDGRWLPTTSSTAVNWQQQRPTPPETPIPIAWSPSFLWHYSQKIIIVVVYTFGTHSISRSKLKEGKRKTWTAKAKEIYSRLHARNGGRKERK